MIRISVHRDKNQRKAKTTSNNAATVFFSWGSRGKFSYAAVAGFVYVLVTENRATAFSDVVAAAAQQ